MLAVLTATLGLAGIVTAAAPAQAAVTSVRGSACGYFVNVGLFGGPQSVRGCGQLASAPATAQSPFVTLPPSGGPSNPVTDPDGAAGVYGPATIFGGIWPDNVQNAPPSGPITVNTQGTTGAGGTVSSSADITLYATPIPVHCIGDPAGTTNCTLPGGFGPNPVWGDSLHVECSASETAVSGLTRFSNAFLATATDADGAPLPSATESVPNTPPVNYTRSGVITNVGDVFTVVFNQQIVNADGSLTVNAVHMYLFGPTAVGEVVKGQVTCGTTPNSVSHADTVKPFCSVPIVMPNGPSDPTPKVPRQELVGVFDAGGLQAISNVQVTNGTVQLGNFPNNDSDPSNDYLTFVPGQTGPLAIIATRTSEAAPMPWAFDAVDAAGNTTHCTGVVSPSSSGHAVSDFDGDGNTDEAVFRPSTNVWYLNTNSPASILFGATDDIPVPADYNGDGKTDVAVFRPSNGVWYVQNPPSSTAFGVSGDVPVPGDYNGDGKAEAAVFRPSNGVWYLSGPPAASTAFGTSGDIPVPGDYNGDGKTDIAVFRPSTNTWYVQNPAQAVVFGASGDIPVPGDYNGDGKTDIAVFRPSNGVWYVLNPATSTAFGSSGDVPVPGDYNGDGKTDFAVFRPGSGVWYVQNPPSSPVFGTSGDVPLPLASSIRRAFFP